MGGYRANAARTPWKQGRGGRPAQRCRRNTVDAIRYLVREGIRWRAMPADFPHWRSVYDALDGWGKRRDRGDAR